MTLDLEHIRKTYSNMDDSKLERIAKFEIAGLQPEVIPIVISEIQKRGLDKNLLTGNEAQTKELSEEEVFELTEKVRGLDCPNCGKSHQGLVGGIIRKVRSYLILTQHEKRPMIACKSCLEKERDKQLMLNCLFGWWAFPWGFFYHTPNAIIGHYLDNSKIHEISESIIIDFVVQNIGELKTNWENEDKIVDFIYHQNTLNY